MRHSLAEPDDPIVLADGRVVEPERPFELEQSVPQQKTLSRPADYKPSVRQTTKDLPAPTRSMNAIGVVFMYTMLGVADTEIASVLNITIPQIKEIKSSDAYSKTFEMMMHAFIDANSDVLQSRIAAMAHGALSTVASLASNSKIEGVKLKASIDLLDRAGTKKADQVKNNGMSMGQLRIVVTTPSKDTSIDVEIDRGL